MDFSKLSDQDLLALKAGDYSKLSDTALLALKNDTAPATPEGPGILKSAALGAMSGIPGAETAVSGIEAMSPDTTYAQAHQGLEEAKNQAWEKHPVAYGTGKGAGMVGTGLALPATASLGGAAALGAGLGALSGVDTASTPTEAVKGGLEGAATGTVLGGLGHGLGKAVESIPGFAKSALSGLTEKGTPADIEAYLKNPEAINLAPSKEQIGEKVAGLTGDIGKASGQLSQEARGMLNPENAVDLQDIKNTAMDAVKKYFTEGKAATTSDETSIKSIIDQYQKLAEIADPKTGKVSEPLLRQMIDRIQAATKETTYGNPEASAAQQSLKEFSGKLNDLLRSTNAPYAEAMAPAAEAANLSKNLQEGFGIEKGQPTNATATKISGLTKEGKPETQDLATQLQQMTGTDIRQMMENTSIKDRLNEPGSGGLLKTAVTTLGYGMGRMTGVPFGGIAGAAGGRFAGGAMNGGSIAKNLMNIYLAGKQSWPGQIAGAIGKFGPILINAAKVGGNQLAATHFVLATSDPEYQNLMDHAQQNTPEGQ